MSKPTPEQQSQLNKLGAKFVSKGIWTGIHHGAMMFVMNLILVMGVAIAHMDKFLSLIGAVAIAIFVIRRMNSVLAQDSLKFKEEVKKIIKN